jgi:hypothetical protein
MNKHYYWVLIILIFGFSSCETNINQPKIGMTPPLMEYKITDPKLLKVCQCENAKVLYGGNSKVNFSRFIDSVFKANPNVPEEEVMARDFPEMRFESAILISDSKIIQFDNKEKIKNIAYSVAQNFYNKPFPSFIKNISNKITVIFKEESGIILKSIKYYNFEFNL